MKLTHNQIVGMQQALFERYPKTVKLCDMPDAEFATGGTFNTLAVQHGYSSGKAFANDCNAWSETLENALYGMERETTFVLKRLSDGWYVAPGGKHTCDPHTAIPIEQEDLMEWLKTYGKEYDSIPLDCAPIIT